MPQYFIAVNKTKKEYFDPGEIGGNSCLGPWCISRAAGVMLYLLRQSDNKFYGALDPFKNTFAGRWANDRVSIVGDYDSSRLYYEEEPPKGYRNIGRELVKQYNKYLGDPGKEWHLKYTPDK